MFAPNFHRLSPTLGKVRRGLGFPTIFNCVGPLCNPASAPHQLIGVWGEEMVPKMANALARLGTKKSWVVHGFDGLDEISLSGPTFVADVVGESVDTFEIVPEDFGLSRERRESMPRSSDPVSSASLILGVLNNECEESRVSELVEINAAASILLARPDLSRKSVGELASETIRNGSALVKLEDLRRLVNCHA
jgi:anthranilate phosphoribosyltransferase